MDTVLSEERDFEVYDPRHPDHQKILEFAKRFTFGQTGACLQTKGTALKLNDPFHLWMNW